MNLENNGALKTRYILSDEFFDVFGIDGEPINSWIDCKIEINDVINYQGRDKIFTEGYIPKYDSITNRKREHIQRIRSLMKLDPIQWKPISLDMDWSLYSPIIEDGHHRCFAAKLLKLTKIPIQWGGVREVFENHFPISFKNKLFW